MDHELLGKVMGLVLTDPYYENQKIWGSRNAIYYAVKHGKCLGYEVGGEFVGYCTYGFLTEGEFESGAWNGAEVYRRDQGGVLFFPKFCCRAGRRDVIRFIREIQGYLSERYPGVSTARGLRVYPDGGTRNEIWHRKAV